MNTQRHSETSDQQSIPMAQPSLSLVSNDRAANVDPRDENAPEQLGYRFGRFLRSAIHPGQSRQPEGALRDVSLLSSRANQPNASPAQSPARRQPDHAVLDFRAARKARQPVSGQQLKSFSQDIAADGLREITDTVMARYGMKQSRTPQAAEAILGGAIILGLALKGDLLNIAAHGIETIEAVTTILQFTLSLLVGPFQAELLAAVAGSLALVLYSRWSARNQEQAMLSLQAS